jgi:hypothetical protein
MELALACEDKLGTGGVWIQIRSNTELVGLVTHTVYGKRHIYAVL